jgi:hypothetical protein
MQHQGKSHVTKVIRKAVAVAAILLLGFRRIA